MANSREFTEQFENEHAIVDPVIEVRDNLGALAVATLAADPSFSAMTSEQKVTKLFQITADLHNAYDYCRMHGHFTL